MRKSLSKLGFASCLGLGCLVGCNYDGSPIGSKSMAEDAPKPMKSDPNPLAKADPQESAVLAALESFGDPPVEDSQPAQVRKGHSFTDAVMKVMKDKGMDTTPDPAIVTDNTHVTGPDNKRVAVRTYRPKDAGDAMLPVIVYIHGGGWVIASVDKNAKLLAAESVLIVGGGPVAVELAGEIVTDFPNKKVTLVHGGNRLIEFVGATASTKALKWLQSKKVTVILNERMDVDDLAGPNYVTKNGTAIHADMHFVCVGQKVGSSWLRGSDLEAVMDSNGRLKVDRHMRVEGHSNVYALGDICNTKESKQGYLAQQQAAVVIANIKKQIKDPQVAKLSEYKPATSTMAVVSLGRNLGLMQMPLGTLLGRLPGMLKSKDLFVGASRKVVGLRA